MEVIGRVGFLEAESTLKALLSVLSNRNDVGWSVSGSRSKSVPVAGRLSTTHNLGGERLRRSRDEVHRPGGWRILFGSDESIFAALPERVLANLRHPTSENALVWNLLYPLAQPTLKLNDFLNLRPQWGTSALIEVDDAMTPYFWGYNIEGERLSLLDETLHYIDGPGQQTEVDVFLVGRRNLILVEAKHMSGLGRCSRYGQQRCPEIHFLGSEQGDDCRYWREGEANFQVHVDFGPRPAPEENPPPCNRHYQLGRTLLVGNALGERLERTFHLWLIIPHARWRSVESDWLDFVDRVRDDKLWRRLRVLAWENVKQLSHA